MVMSPLAARTLLTEISRRVLAPDGQAAACASSAPEISWIASANKPTLNGIVFAALLTIETDTFRSTFRPVSGLVCPPFGQSIRTMLVTQVHGQQYRSDEHQSELPSLMRP